MNLDTLIKSAEQLGPFSAEAAELLHKHEQLLLARVNQRLQERDDLNLLIGEHNLELMKDNHANHIRFMRSMLEAFQARELVVTVLWVFRVYRARGFSALYWSVQMNVWLEELQKLLPESANNTILPLYEWIIVHIPAFDTLSSDT